MTADLPLLATAAGLIEFGGAIVITSGAVKALAVLATGKGVDRARLLIIAGALSGLGFKTAATLLKAIELGTWHGIAMFASILILRTFLKQVFVWERDRLLEAQQGA